ncbi:hypothetical protein EGH24_05665 [Halonotius terrestris]|uniref:DUF8119 domain-containing protein n=1 Tax=Halonotius terrestris TaxID=2487750 RepID=A0A8J8TD00_9EURY|nr:hypothetical protein [Halonotius terrestris]TQQ82923.1 hypothetical protein EGH24_05665 [Halonotius terrestris]
MSRLKRFIRRLYKYETNLLEDIAASTIIFLGISIAWSYAPNAWPQAIYYIILAIGLFGYFKFVSPPPNEREKSNDA